MRKLSMLLLVLVLSFQGFSKNFIFPNVPFIYAKIFEFNQDFEVTHQLDQAIYNGTEFAKSKKGEGILLKESFHTALAKIVSKGVDELIYGLSSCYIPRHGIVYYNQSDQPVASLSICFECERIGIWSIKPISFKQKMKNIKTEKPEDQLNQLKTLVNGIGLKVD
jgi:hypothetical protein